MNADVVIDLICFKLDEVKEMVGAEKDGPLALSILLDDLDAWTDGDHSNRSKERETPTG